MTQAIWIYSRMRVSGSDSDFEVSLRESVHLSDARVRVDKLTFSDSFYTTDAGQNIYFSAPNGSFSSASVPQGAYTGFTLAAAIEAATGRDTTYSVMTNSISHVLAGADRPWLSDAEVAARTVSFPPGASGSDPRSLNAVLGEGTNSGSTVTWACVRMAPARMKPVYAPCGMETDEKLPSGARKYKFWPASVVKKLSTNVSFSTRTRVSDKWTLSLKDTSKSLSEAPDTRIRLSTQTT